MLSKKMETAFNKQINAELYSGYLYLSMSSYFNSLNLEGFATWMKVQALEEQYHGMKKYNFVQERGGRVILDTIEKPATEWESPIAAVEGVLAHERKVTGLINDLVDLAMEERDHASNNFLQWFVKEQVEEEATADDVLQKLKLAGGAGQGLFLMDQEMGKRIFNLPPDIKVPIMLKPL